MAADQNAASFSGFGTVDNETEFGRDQALTFSPAATAARPASVREPVDQASGSVAALVERAHRVVGIHAVRAAAVGDNVGLVASRAQLRRHAVMASPM